MHQILPYLTYPSVVRGIILWSRLHWLKPKKVCLWRWAKLTATYGVQNQLQHPSTWNYVRDLPLQQLNNIPGHRVECPTYCSRVSVDCFQYMPHGLTNVEKWAWVNVFMDTGGLHVPNEIKISHPMLTADLSWQILFIVTDHVMVVLCIVCSD